MNAAFLAVGPAPALANAGQRVEAHPALRASQSVNLGLLSDHPLLADRLHVQESAKGDFVWTGQIRNEPLSRVTLASSDGQLSGVVDRPLRQGGNDVLLIEPQPDGTSLLVRGDAEPLAGPGCPELKVPWPSGSGAGKFSENWPVATAANPAVIDLMILYTPASRARYGASGIQAKILQAVADANIGYQRSQVHITLNLVHMGELSYQESGNMIEALVKLVGDGDGVMDEVHQWRNATSADLVTLVDEDNNYCGISYLMGTPTVEFAPYAFSVVSSGCLNYQTLHHELGHNLGSGHDRANGYGGSYPYSYGFHRCTMDGTSFRTVMAYPCSAGYAPRVNWFSNPNILYNGIPMGVSYELDPANCSDNARSLNQNAHCGAAFRQRPEPAPVAPANLVAFTVAPDRISLAWNDLATNSSGAKVERSPDTLNWIEIAELASGTKAYSDAGLGAGLTYSYRVRAFNSTGCSDYSNIATATTPEQPPLTPANLAASATSPQQIELVWLNPCATATTIRVQRTTDLVNWFELVALGRGSARHVDSSVTANTLYYYRLRACNDGGCSAASAMASAATLPAVPMAPANLTATPLAATAIDLAWVNQSADALTVRIERSTNPASWTELEVLAPGISRYLDGSVVAGVTYHYRVRAANAGGFSAYSDLATATSPVLPPLAPDHLAALPVSTTQVELSWELNSVRATVPRVERSANLAFWVELAVLDPGATNYSDTSVSAGTTYHYRVRACQLQDCSAFSALATATTPMLPPRPPVNFTAEAASDNQIHLAWQDASSDETGFRVERSSDGLTFAVVATLEANVTSYVDANLAPGQTCYYRLCACNSGGSSAASNVAVATTRVLPPLPPGGLTAEAVSASEIRLAWQDASSDETGFRVERSSDGLTFAVVEILDANTGDYDDGSLTPGMTRFYRLRAFNSGGESEASSVVQVTSLVAPAIPANFTATALSSNQIRITWQFAVGNVSGYWLERSTDGTIFVPLIVVGADMPAWLDLGLVPGATYYYRCRASGAGGASPWSTVALATTPIGAAPANPTSLVLTVLSSSAIKLSWRDHAKNEAGFRVERSLDGINFDVVATLSSNLVTYTNVGLVAATKYSYRVCAFRAGIQSAYTSVASVSTLPLPPIAPGTLTARPISKTQVTLIWRDNSENETGFKIERSTNGATYSQIASVAAGVTTYVNTGLSGGKLYYYRVRATNTGGNSGFSNFVLTRTPTQ